MRYFILILYSLISLVIGICLIVASSGVLDLDKVLADIEMVFDNPYGRVLVGLIGALIILLWIKLIVGRFEYPKQKSIVISDDRERQSTITVSAIEEIVKRAVDSFKKAKDVRVKVVPIKKQIGIFVYLVLFSGVNISSFVDEAQGKVELKVKDVVGQDKNIKIKIEIKRIVAAKNQEFTEDEDPKIPFRNYT